MAATPDRPSSFPHLKCTPPGSFQPRSKWMQQQMEVAAHWGTYTYNKEQRDLVAIGAACGVTTAFKAPVRAGGETDRPCGRGRQWGEAREDVRLHRAGEGCLTCGLWGCGLRGVAGPGGDCPRLAAGQGMWVVCGAKEQRNRGDVLC